MGISERQLKNCGVRVKVEREKRLSSARSGDKAVPQNKSKSKKTKPNGSCEPVKEGQQKTKKLLQKADILLDLSSKFSGQVDKKRLRQTVKSTVSKLGVLAKVIGSEVEQLKSHRQQLIKKRLRKPEKYAAIQKGTRELRAKSRTDAIPRSEYNTVQRTGRSRVGPKTPIASTIIHACKRSVGVQNTSLNCSKRCFVPKKKIISKKKLNHTPNYCSSTCIPDEHTGRSSKPTPVGFKISRKFTAVRSSDHAQQRAELARYLESCSDKKKRVPALRRYIEGTTPSTSARSKLKCPLKYPLKYTSTCHTRASSCEDGVASSSSEDALSAQPPKRLHASDYRDLVQSDTTLFPTTASSSKYSTASHSITTKSELTENFDQKREERESSHHPAEHDRSGQRAKESYDERRNSLANATRKVAVSGKEIKQKAEQHSTPRNSSRLKQTALKPNKEIHEAPANRRKIPSLFSESESHKLATPQYIKQNLKISACPEKCYKTCSDNKSQRSGTPKDKSQESTVSRRGNLKYYSVTPKDLKRVAKPPVPPSSTRPATPSGVSKSDSYRHRAHTNNKRSTTLSIPSSPYSDVVSNKVSESKSRTLGTPSVFVKSDFESQDKRSTATPDGSSKNYSESGSQKLASPKYINHNNRASVTPRGVSENFLEVKPHKRRTSSERKREINAVSEKNVVPKEIKPILKEPRIVRERFSRKDSIEVSQLESCKPGARRHRSDSSSSQRLAGGECLKSSTLKSNLTSVYAEDCRKFTSHRTTGARDISADGDPRKELQKCSKGTQQNRFTLRGDSEDRSKQGSLHVEDPHSPQDHSDSVNSGSRARSKSRSNVRCQVCQGIKMNNPHHGQQSPQMGGAHMQPCSHYNYSSKEVYCSCSCQNGGYPPQMQHCCRTYAVVPACNPCNACNAVPCHPTPCYCRYTTGTVVGYSNNRTVSDLNTAEFYHRKDERGRSPAPKRRSQLDSKDAVLTPDQVKEVRKLKARRERTRERESREVKGATTDEDSKDQKEKSHRSKSRELRKHQQVTTDDELNVKDPALAPEQVKEVRRLRARSQISKPREPRQRASIQTEEELDSKYSTLTPEQVKQVKRQKARSQSSKSIESPRSKSKELRKLQGVTTDDELESKDPTLTPEQVRQVRTLKAQSQTAKAGETQSSKSREPRQRESIKTAEDFDSKKPALTPEQVKQVRRQKARSQSSKSKESQSSKSREPQRSKSRELGKLQGVTTDDELESQDPALTPEQVHQVRKLKAQSQSAKARELQQRPGVLKDEDSKVRRSTAQSAKAREFRQRHKGTKDDELDSKKPALTPREKDQFRGLKAKSQTAQARDYRKHHGASKYEESDPKDPALTAEEEEQVRKRKAPTAKPRELRQRQEVTTDDELDSRDPADEQVRILKAQSQRAQERELRHRQGVKKDEDVHTKDSAPTAEKVEQVRRQRLKARELRQRQDVTTDDELDSAVPALSPAELEQKRRLRAQSQNPNTRELRQRQEITTESTDPALTAEEVEQVKRLKAQSMSAQARELRQREVVTRDDELDSKQPALTPEKEEHVRKLKEQSTTARELRKRQGVKSDDELDSNDPALTAKDVEQVKRLKAQSQSSKVRELRQRQGVTNYEDLNSKDPALTAQEVEQVRKLKAESVKARELRQRQGVTADEELDSADPALTPEEVEQVQSQIAKARELRQRQGVTSTEDLNSKDPALTAQEVEQVRKLKAQSAKAREMRQRQGVTTDDELNSTDPALTAEELDQVRRLKAHSQSAQAKKLRRRQGVTNYEDLNSKDPASLAQEIEQVRRLMTQSKKGRELRQRQGVTSDDELDSTDPALTAEEVEQVRKLKAQSRSAQARELRERQGVTNYEDLNSKDPALTTQEVEQVRKLKAQSVKARELRHRQGVTRDDELDSRDPALTAEEVDQVRRLKAQSQSAKAEELQQSHGATSYENLKSKDPALTAQEEEEVRILKAQSTRARGLRQRQDVTTDDEFDSRDPAITGAEVEQERRLKAQSQGAQAKKLRRRQGVTDTISKDPASLAQEIEQVRRLVAQSAQARELRQRQGVTIDDELDSRDPALTAEEVNQVRKLKPQSQSAQAREFRQRHGVTNYEDLNSKDPALTTQEVEQVRKLKAQSVKARELRQRQGVTTDDELDSRDLALTVEEVDQDRSLNAESQSSQETDLRQRHGAINIEDLNSKDPALTAREIEQVRRQKAQSAKARQLRERQEVTTDDELDSRDPALTAEKVDQVRRLKAQSQRAQARDLRKPHGVTNNEDLNSKDPALMIQEVEQVSRLKAQSAKARQLRERQEVTTDDELDSRDPTLTAEEVDQVRRLKAQSQRAQARDLRKRHGATNNEDLNSKDPALTIQEVEQVRRLKAQSAKARQLRERQEVSTDDELDSRDPALTAEEVDQVRRLKAQSQRPQARELRRHLGVRAHDEWDSKELAQPDQFRNQKAQSAKEMELRQRQGATKYKEYKDLDSKDPALTPEEEEQMRRLKTESHSAKERELRQRQGITKYGALDLKDPALTSEEVEQVRRLNAQNAKARELRQRQRVRNDEDLDSSDPALTSEEIEQARRLKAQSQIEKEWETQGAERRGITESTTHYDMPFDAPAETGRDFRGPPGETPTRNDQTASSLSDNNYGETATESYRYDYHTVIGQTVTHSDTGYIAEIYDEHEATETEITCTDDVTSVLPCFTNISCTPSLPRQCFEYDLNHHLQNGARLQGRKHSPEHYQQRVRFSPPFENTRLTQESNVPWSHEDTTQARLVPNKQSNNQTIYTRIEPFIQDIRQRADCTPGKQARPNHGSRSYRATNRNELSRTPLSDEATSSEQRRYPQYDNRASHRADSSYFPPGGSSYYFNKEAENSQAMPKPSTNQGPIEDTGGQQDSMHTRGASQHVPHSSPANYETSDTDDESFSRIAQHENRRPPMYTENICEEGTVYSEGDEVCYNLKRETEHLYRNGCHRYAEERKEEIRGSVTPDREDDYTTSSSRANATYGPSSSYNVGYGQSTYRGDVLDDWLSRPRQTPYEVPYEVEYTGCPCMQPTFDYLARTYHVGRKYDGDVANGADKNDSGAKNTTNN